MIRITLPAFRIPATTRFRRLWLTLLVFPFRERKTCDDPYHRQSEVSLERAVASCRELGKHLLHTADMLMEPIKGLRRDMSRARGEVAPLLSCRSSHDKKNNG
jgi:hypothetical protein